MNPIATGLLAWLATYAIHSTLLLGLAWLVLRLRRADAATANLVWKLALVGGIVTASVQVGLGVRPGGSIVLGVEGQETRVMGLESRVEGNTPAPEALDPRPSSLDGGSTSLDPRPSSLDRGTSSLDPRPSTLILGGWALLATTLILWYAGRRLILVGRLGDRRPVRQGPMAERLTELRRSAGVRRPIALTASTAISSPVALGTSEICLPAAALDDLAPDQQDAMLAHELAHLVRRDPQWLVLACLVERAFFFQPLNRLASRGIMESAEYLADDWAAHRSGHVPLARCLVKVAEWIQASPLGVPMAGMAEERSHLSARVARLLDNRNRHSTMSRYLAPVASVLALAATVAFVPGAAAVRAEPGNLAAGEAAIPMADLSGMDLSGELGVPPDGDQPVESEVSLQDTATRPNPNPKPRPNTGGAPAQPDTAVVRALMQRLSDEDAEVRRAAADALGRIENPIAIPGLVRALDDPDADVRRAAADALGQFESPAVIPDLVDALKDPDIEVRRAALDALGSYDKGVPAEPIRPLLASDNAEMRAQAAEMLGDMRDRSSRAAIEKLVSDPDADVRHEALHALGHLGDPASIPVVTSALSDPNGDVRQTAFESLEEMNATVEPGLVARGFGDNDTDVREAAIELAESRRMSALSPQLARLLDDPNGSVRERAAEALTEMGDPAAREALQRALNHADPKVRRIAVEYFGEENDS